MCKLMPTPSELRLLPKVKELVDWDKVETELSEKAPTLSLILKAVAKSKDGKRKAQPGIIGMVAAILLKSRNEKMARAQAVNSIVMFAGHANKKVYNKITYHGSSRDIV